MTPALKAGEPTRRSDTSAGDATGNARGAAYGDRGPRPTPTPAGATSSLSGPAPPPVAWPAMKKLILLVALIALGTVAARRLLGD